MLENMDGFFFLDLFYFMLKIEFLGVLYVEKQQILIVKTQDFLFALLNANLEFCKIYVALKYFKNQ